MSSKLTQMRKGGKEALDKLLHERVVRRDTPALFFLATNAKETIYSNQEGELVHGDETSGQVNAATTLELYSQTKLVTCLAALQLVDGGLVSLDDEADIEKHLPELGKLQLLKGYGEDGKPILEKPTKKSTLRLLMSHQAGFVYAHAESLLSAYSTLYPEPSIFHPSATLKTILTPLVFEPGSDWLYGTAIDLVGKLVERVSGQRLDEYFQKNIFDPLGLKTLTFFPTDEIKKRKMAVCYRKPDGSIAAFPGGFGMGRPSDVGHISTELLLGGAGLFGTLADYLVILRAVLQADPSSPNYSDKPIISPESFKELFKGCVRTEIGKQAIVDMISKSAMFDPPLSSANVDHSVGFMLSMDGLTGRRKPGSGSWSGAAKTQFWVDPTTGIAGICGTQLLSPSPDPFYSVYEGYEKELYANLESGEATEKLREAELSGVENGVKVYDLK